MRMGSKGAKQRETLLYLTEFSEIDVFTRHFGFNMLVEIDGSSFNLLYGFTEICTSSCTRPNNFEIQQIPFYIIDKGIQKLMEKQKGM